MMSSKIYWTTFSARKKLMLIDACHSGEVDKADGIAMNKIADSLGLRDF